MSAHPWDRSATTVTRRRVLGGTAAVATGVAGCMGGGGDQATPRAEERCEGVEPSVDTAESGEYGPLTRPLFTYVNKSTLKRPEVALFAREFVEKSTSNLFSKAGYVPRTQAESQTLLDDLNGAIAEVGGPPPGEEEPEGQVDVTGSPTMFELTREFAPKFQRKHPGASVGIQTTGTRQGFRQFFCPGRAEVNNAARRMTETERSLCRDNGVEWVELRVAADPLTVVINTDNDWIPCLTVSELGRIWGADGAETWSDLDREWPDETIERVAPTESSATVQYFSETVLGENGTHTSDYSAVAPGDIIAAGVSESRHAIGYLGHTFYVRDSNDATPVAIDPSR